MWIGQRSVDLFFFNDTATTEIYTLSLHDALPISAAAARAGSRIALRRPPGGRRCRPDRGPRRAAAVRRRRAGHRDRKSTRLNSSHANISYAVFCLKKKTTETGALPGPRLPLRQAP